MTNKEKTAYTAGIIDGEGHIRLQKSKNGQGRVFYRPLIIINQKERVLLDWFMKEHGGYLRQEKPTMRLGKYRQWWVWTLSGKKAVALADAIRPYLIVKQDQVKRISGIKYGKNGYSTNMKEFIDK